MSLASPSTIEEAKLPERKIGDYSLLHTLGAGAQGKVKLGRAKNGSLVALKIMDKNGRSDRAWESLQKEIEILKSADHPNIVRLIEVMDTPYPKKDGTFKDVVTIVMELASGGEIFDFLMHTGAFPEGIARAFFQQLVSGLSHCHSQGVFHRDLKPENILLDGAYNLKIADFGLAAKVEAVDAGTALLSTRCGTRPYQAPEVLQGLSYRGEPADVWACGVLLFILLCGAPPFEQANDQDWWFRQVRRGKYKRFWKAHLRMPAAVAGFTPGSIALLTQIFNPDPDTRITLAGIQQDAWFSEAAPDGGMLTAEMQRRKKQVDAVNGREKIERENCRDQTYRDFDDGSGLAESSLAPLMPTEGVQQFTTFYLNETTSEVVHLLDQAFSTLATSHTTDQQKFKAKATVNNVQLVAKIYATGDKSRPMLHAIELTRRGGDLFKFQKSFRDITSALQHAIVAGPEERAALESVDPSVAAMRAAGAASASDLQLEVQ